MVNKQLQKHDFLTGGPVLQYEIPFVNGTMNYGTWDPQDIILDDDQVIGGITNQVIRGITINDNIDNNIIFQANEDTIQWMGQEVMTEERVREIVNEILGRE